MFYGILKDKEQKIIVGIVSCDVKAAIIRDSNGLMKEEDFVLLDFKPQQIGEYKLIGSKESESFFVFPGGKEV